MNEEAKNVLSVGDGDKKRTEDVVVKTKIMDEAIQKNRETHTIRYDDPSMSKEADKKTEGTEDIMDEVLQQTTPEPLSIQNIPMASEEGAKKTDRAQEYMDEVAQIKTPDAHPKDDEKMAEEVVETTNIVEAEVAAGAEEHQEAVNGGEEDSDTEIHYIDRRPLRRVREAATGGEDIELIYTGPPPKIWRQEGTQTELTAENNEDLEIVDPTENTPFKSAALTKMVSFFTHKLTDLPIPTGVEKLLAAFKEKHSVLYDALIALGNDAQTEAIKEEFDVEGEGKEMKLSLKEWKFEELRMKWRGEEEGERKAEEEKEEGETVQNEEKDAEEVEEMDVEEEQTNEPTNIIRSPSPTDSQGNSDSDIEILENPYPIKEYPYMSAALAKLDTTFKANLRELGRPIRIRKMWKPFVKKHPVLTEALHSIGDHLVLNWITREYDHKRRGRKMKISLKEWHQSEEEEEKEGEDEEDDEEKEGEEEDGENETEEEKEEKGVEENDEGGKKAEEEKELDEMETEEHEEKDMEVDEEKTPEEEDAAVIASLNPLDKEKVEGEIVDAVISSTIETIEAKGEDEERKEEEDAAMNVSLSPPLDKQKAEEENVDAIEAMDEDEDMKEKEEDAAVNISENPLDKEKEEDEIIEFILSSIVEAVEAKVEEEKQKEEEKVADNGDVAPAESADKNENAGSKKPLITPFPGPSRFPTVRPGARVPPNSRLLLHPVLADHPQSHHHVPHLSPSDLFPHLPPPTARQLYLQYPHPVQIQNFITKTLQCLHLNCGTASLSTLNAIHSQYFGFSFQQAFEEHIGRVNYGQITVASQGQITVQVFTQETQPEHVFFSIKFLLQDLPPLQQNIRQRHEPVYPPMHMRLIQPPFMDDPRVKDLANKMGAILERTGREVSEPEMSLIYARSHDQPFEFFKIIPPQFGLDAMAMITGGQILTRVGPNGHFHFRLHYQPQRLLPHEYHLHAQRPRLDSTGSSSHSVIALDDSE